MPTKPKPAPAPNPSSEFQKLLTSAFADSMFAITGRPRAMATSWNIDDDPTVAGAYYPRADSLVLTSGAFRGPGNEYNPLVGAPQRREPYPDPVETPEGLFAHELAHRFMDRKGNAYDPEGQHAAVRLHFSLMNNFGSVPLHGYAATNSSEYEAQAFSNAVQFLRATAGDPTHPGLVQQDQPLLARYDAKIPGTTKVVQYLLAQPLYAGHPLNVTRGLNPVAPDATAVTAVRPPVAASRALPVTLVRAPQ